MDLDFKNELKKEIIRMLNAPADTEIYANSKQLKDHIDFMTPKWLHRFGYLLPCTRAEVEMPDGRMKTSGWVYPVRKLMEKCGDGTIKELVYGYTRPENITTTSYLVYRPELKFFEKYEKAYKEHQSKMEA